jgi:tetratricopeptide (TPR) repeat protein
MKKNYMNGSAFILVLLMFIGIKGFAQLNLPRGSQKAKVTQQIGITDITISYSRPAVKDRTVWGELVPYGMNNLGFGTATESPWRAGANENTVIKFTDNVLIEGKPLNAGKYGLHMIVYEDNKATVIFSKNHEAWGSYFYEPSEDALRVDVITKEIPHTEELTYLFTTVEPNSAIASLNWEKKQIPFKIQVDVTEIVLSDIRHKLQNSPGFNRQTWEQAANFSLNNDGDLNEALGWINAAIEGQFFSEKNFNNLSTKSKILVKQGKAAEADLIMDEALKFATIFEVHGYGRQLIAQERKEKAVEVFKMNAKNYKGQWPVDYGLARGYSAMGDYKRALKHLKIAAQRAPDQQNKDAIATNISKLENGEDIN